jgi:proline racemase
MDADSFELEYSLELSTFLDHTEVIGSHTGGESTRVVISGGPDLGHGTVAQQLAKFRQDFDDFRASVVNEPCGNDVLVGALIRKPANTSCAAAVIFFNCEHSQYWSQN